MINLVLAAVAMIAVAAGEVRVVDGDTIDAAGARWRLVGFDTPETFHAKCAREWMLGIVAKNRLRALIDGAGRAEIYARKGRDRYKRWLGELRLDGGNVATIMIAERLARPYKRGRRQGWCGTGWVR